MIKKIPKNTKLQSMIVELLNKQNCSDSAYLELLEYMLKLFDKQGLNDWYYGYHDTSHELAVTYVTLAAASGNEFYSKISEQDFKHLYAASLFHDYEPLKTTDKTSEEFAAEFVIHDLLLKKLFKKLKIDPYVVAILILRTFHPWNSSKNQLSPIMKSYFKKSTFADNESNFDDICKLGWILSISDRIGAYSLGNFLEAISLAKKNAHSLGWDPEYMIRRSVSYFEQLLHDEYKMTDQVLYSLPDTLRKTFMDNVLGFFKLRTKEVEIRSSIIYDKIKLVTKQEPISINNEFKKKLYDIFDELPNTLQFKKNSFFESLDDLNTILVTLRIGSDNGKIIGFAKGGPLESYSLPTTIVDKNFGRENSVFMEPIALTMGYWGHGGGTNLRQALHTVAFERGYTYLTSLQLREVIQNRLDRGRNIEFVHKFNPQKLDYYRVRLD